MRAVVQRTKSAKVRVDDAVIGKIGKGLLLFLGVEETDEQADLDYICDKVLHLRIFDDEQGKMNLSVEEVEGSVLVVSQFTLYGDARKGRRPSFIKAARPEKAVAFYKQCIDQLGQFISVQSGQFQAVMDVELVNDGPVTLLLDSRKVF